MTKIKNPALKPVFIEPDKNIKYLYQWSLLKEYLVKVYATRIKRKLYLLLVTSAILPHIGYEVNKSLSELKKLTPEEVLNLFEELNNNSIKQGMREAC